MNDQPSSQAGSATPASGFPRRVLMVTGYLWGGGAEWHVLNLAWSLQKMGVQVEVAYVLAGTADAQDAWRRHGFEPFALRSPAKMLSLKGEGYDLIHAHLFKGEMVAAMASRVLRVPMVITRHSLDWQNLSVWQRLLLRTIVQRRARGMIAVSDAVADVSRTAITGRNVPIRVIRHGIAPELLRGRLVGTDIRKELGIEGHPLIGTAARLSPDKGLSYLLEAYKRAQPELADWHIVIAGDGPQRQPLEQLAEQLGIASRVHLLGWRSDALDIVRSLDIFALPSVREGFGLALLEAMTFGTAAIVNDLPAIRETANNAAVYVQPADVDMFAEALRAMTRQTDRREELRDRSKHQAARFSADEMARQTLAFYREIA